MHFEKIYFLFWMAFIDWSIDTAPNENESESIIIMYYGLRANK